MDQFNQQPPWPPQNAYPQQAPPPGYPVHQGNVGYPAPGHAVSGPPVPMGQHPGQPPSGGAPGGAKSGRAKKFFSHGAAVLGGFVLAFVVAGVIGSSASTFEQVSVEQETQRVLTQDYGYDEVQGVDCPEAQKVDPQAKFSCAVGTNSGGQQVELTVVDEQGTFRVGELR